MKFEAPRREVPARARARRVDLPVGASTRESEESTRDRLCRAIMARGPVTTNQLATDLGLTAAAVRRHLDGLLAEGLVAVWEAPPAQRRGRGRPARSFIATDAGHAAMSAGYEELAASALGFLREEAGEDAVRRFAERWVADLEQRYRGLVAAAGPDPAARARALARELSRDGFAASTRPVAAGGPGTNAVGVQLCQGHCPVQHVARAFPQLCDAERDAFSRLLGVHVQRLATLAHGEHVCTTYIPGGARAESPAVPAASRGSP